MFAIWAGGIVWLVTLLVLGGGVLWEWAGLSGRMSDQMPLLPPLMFLAGALYVGLAVTSLLWLRADPATGFADVLFVMLVVWSCDIGAYAIGRWLGGPRLAPAISPSKTWAGAAGGLGAAMLTALLVAASLASGTSEGPASSLAAGPLARTILVGLVLAISAQAGDLLESWVKRRCGVKHSGRLMPGHGGLLDRLDGVLAAAPVAAGLALMLGPAAVLWR